MSEEELLDDEILLLAQKGKRNDEFETRQYDRAKLLAFGVSMLVCIIFIAVRYIIQHQWDYGIMAVFFWFNCADTLYTGIRNRKVFEIVCGIVEVMCAIGTTAMYIGGLK